MMLTDREPASRFLAWKLANAPLTAAPVVSFAMLRHAA